ncbi:Hypothetical protein FKW44_010817 [Caligus rogercresseyi]|uniref:Uncharacterized protein n=1 Tax=Caligus rogercresseyi TaxID=217165 RepID=A0A7T8HHD9_CALRO|nr:Hypothetical protein FKW44_010817 [Caligus rogercresseyi]
MSLNCSNLLRGWKSFRRLLGLGQGRREEATPGSPRRRRKRSSRSLSCITSSDSSDSSSETKEGPSNKSRRGSRDIKTGGRTINNEARTIYPTTLQVWKESTLMESRKGR